MSRRGGAAGRLEGATERRIVLMIAHATGGFMCCRMKAPWHAPQ